MRKQKRRFAFFLFLDCILIGAMAIFGSVVARTFPSVPTSSPTLPATEEVQTSDEAQSVTGTIASVGKKSFSLTLESAASDRQPAQETNPKSMVFLMDKNTTIDGQLRVGARANVTYREDKGNNVAINVRVPS
jgi:Na+-transporting methylmalonyl-CoA/oxaloacetate decarboxylase gamma subunit